MYFLSERTYFFLAFRQYVTFGKKLNVFIKEIIWTRHGGIWEAEAGPEVSLDAAL